MAQTNKDWRARPTTADIWDRTHKKLAVLVLEVDDAIAQEKLVCNLRVGKIEQKSRKLQGGVCGEFFFFSLGDGGNLVIEVSKCLALRRTAVRIRIPDREMVMARIIIDIHPIQFAGEAVLSNPMKEHAEEEVVDMWLPLLPRAKKKDKEVHGNIHIRFLYSCSPETRPRENRGQKNFYYDDHIERLQTGDLIAYSGIGALSSMTKLATNSPYSHVGMIFRLPNKWTQRDELFVLEVTKNTEGFLDAFLERPHSGVVLYRLFERIHQFQGKANVPIDVKRLVDRMWKAHEENVDFLQPRASSGRVNARGESQSFFSLETDLFSELSSGAIGKDGALWEPLGPYNISKHPQQKAEIVELLDTKLLTLLFHAAGFKKQIATGMEIMKDNQRLYPMDVVRYKCFGLPVLLRDVDFSVQAQESRLPRHFFIVQDSAPMGTQPESGPSQPPQALALQDPMQPLGYAAQPQAMMSQAMVTMRPVSYAQSDFSQQVPPLQMQQGTQSTCVPTMSSYQMSQTPATYLPQYYPGAATLRGDVSAPSLSPRLESGSVETNSNGLSPYNPEYKDTEQ